MQEAVVAAPGQVQVGEVLVVKQTEEVLEVVAGCFREQVVVASVVWASEAPGLAEVEVVAVQVNRAAETEAGAETLQLKNLSRIQSQWMAQVTGQ